MEEEPRILSSVEQAIERLEVSMEKFKEELWEELDQLKNGFDQLKEMRKEDLKVLLDAIATLNPNTKGQPGELRVGHF